MATATASVDNSLPAESASDSVEGRSNVSPMEGFTEKVHACMSQCSSALQVEASASPQSKHFYL